VSKRTRSRSAAAGAQRSAPSRSSLEADFFRLLNRVVEPRVRAGWGSFHLVPGGLIVLETRGRRTGRRARVPLAATRVGGSVVVSTFRGRRSQWVRNLAARPRVRFWLRGRERSATAHVIAPGGSAHLPRALRWLGSLLAPYTNAGWAFAVLVPDDGPSALPARRRA
jgi:deazaflavin-dependent oxidoreductase (nitroreductase family)